MTKYSEKLIEFFTRDGRKPVFIEKYWEITPDTPIEDILYTYNEMACRGYLIEERGYFLENAQHYSGKDSFYFLYPSVMFDIPFEMHPEVVAAKEIMQRSIDENRRLTKEEMKELEELYKRRGF